MSESSPPPERQPKFRSARDEVLYLISLDGLQETSGDPECPSGRFTMMELVGDSWVNMLYMYDREIKASGLEDLIELEGHWLLVEDRDGVVEVEEYATAEGLREVFNTTDRLYEFWLIQQQHDLDMEERGDGEEF